MKTPIKKLMPLFVSLVFLYACGNDDEPQEPAVEPNAIIEFTDQNFKAALLEHGKSIVEDNIGIIDTNKDGKIQVKEAEVYSGKIYCRDKNISNLTGLEYFKNITELICDKNNLSVLDITNNSKLTKLSCYKNKLTSLDLTNNLSLKGLNCSWNSLSELDVNNNSLLEEIHCHTNDVLSELKLPDSNSLKLIRCFKNELSELSITNYTSLERLDCYENKITHINITNNITLEVLNCSFNKLTKLNLANSANSTLAIMNAENNPSLTCIQIDEAFTPPSSGWTKDDTASYSSNCP